ncbi:hypothetical protein ZWY2020_034589 [Hordeum vulgare]|nr:hypothetical protein ZWY2020_034589 [Hordeum vulgare]
MGVDVEEIGWSATDETNRSSTKKATKTAAEEAAKPAASDVAEVATSNGDKDVVEEAIYKDANGTAGILAPGVLGHYGLMGSWATDESMTTTNGTPSSSEAPPSRTYLNVGDLQFLSVLGTSRIEAFIGEKNLHMVVFFVGCKVADDQGKCKDESKEQHTPMAMNGSFPQLRALNNGRMECLDC